MRRFRENSLKSALELGGNVRDLLYPSDAKDIAILEKPAGEAGVRC